MKNTTLDNIVYLIKKIFNLDKVIFLLIGIYILILALAPFLDILFPKFLLDELSTNLDIKNILYILIIYSALSFLIFPFIEYIGCIINAKQTNSRMKILFEVQNKVFKIPFKYTEDVDILNKKETVIRSLSGFDSGIQSLLNEFVLLISSLLSLVGYISILASLNIILVLYLLVNIFVMYRIVAKFSNYEVNKTNDIWINNREVNYYMNIMNDFSYGKDIRLLNLKDLIIYKVKNSINISMNMLKQIKKNNFKVIFIDLTLSFFREGFVYFYLIYMFLNNKILIGDFVMFFSAIAGFTELMNSIARYISSINSKNTNIKDIKDFLNLEDLESCDNSNKSNEKFCLSSLEAPYKITFDKVSFKYPNSNKLILDELSLTINQGERLAIVGENGCGKTTLIKLLTRLYEPTSGKIYINNIDINNIPIDSYNKLISVVFQDYKILAFSVIDNIALSDSDVDYTKLIKSMKDSGIYEKIERLPKKENTLMQKRIDDSGIELSQGEKQKLAIARAIYKSGEIIILDEPTAALSPQSEEQVYKEFNNMTKNKTSIFISHRLASTHFCDNIAFIKNGKITEYGSHDFLIDLGNDYAKMYNIQSQYYDVK
ncbi:ABC transporter ATP-binding protein [Clostridium perfringens]|uniref:ABC transporter ATP-binding protein n=1 Tax=Clostridium perfringens TaxID=1502 RepID=UPI0018E4CFD3|nr:ABC transporter ATP-binding protein [Clostridium perfringens]MBI5978595.1 ABC transporter ATP-binding protein [Clostridium perfringens]MBI5981517.1 ABC transporter ATP-binding protein [Clostridium perfringens]MBI5984286.1 ABC transporter ATP-binding protein [Clostridium perfringens]MBI5989998.1 ABC transporter ATP-binding protein [Clostridium perfringens]MBI5995903.1 ABC transporter ATP-binding protein [Clostridium perfringens]